MSWGTRKQLIYIGIVLGVLLLLGALPIISFFDKPPTCTDTIQNQEEEGIDCGGPCTNLCPNKVQPLVLEWARSFEVGDGFYDAVAFIENPNPRAGIDDLLYRFKVYDANNILIAERVGKTFVNPAEGVAIIAPNIKTGNRVPGRTFFEFEEGFIWKRMDPATVFLPSFSIEEKNFSENNGTPRLSAVLRNRTVLPVSGVQIMALLYGVEGNVLGVHTTSLDVLGKSAVEPIIFTWQKPFTETPVRIDILPRYKFSSLRLR